MKRNILNSFKTVLRHNYSNKLSLYLNLSIIFESVATSIWVAAIILTYTRTFYMSMIFGLDSSMLPSLVGQLLLGYG